MEASRLAAGDIARRTGLPPVPGKLGRRTMALVQAGDYDLLVIGLVAAVAAVFLIEIRGAYGVDSWLALAAGREIWQSGIPDHDTLTVMSHGAPWLDQQWLSQLATYGLHRLGGLGLVGVANVALITSGLGGAIAAARRLGVGARTLVVLFPICAWLVLPSGEVRTQAFAFPVFVGTFYILASDSRAPSRRVYWCLPLLILWANLHGSASLGAGLVCLRGLTLGWERRNALRRASAAWRRPLALTAGGPLCLLLTPYGLSIVSYYNTTLFNSTLKHAVTEWQPVTSAPFIAVPVFMLAATAVWSFGRHADRTTLWERAAFLALAIGAIDAVRNASFFSLAAMVIVGLSVDAAVKSRSGEGIPLRPRLNQALAGGAVLVAAIATVTTLLSPRGAFEQARLQRVLAVVRSTADANPSLRVFADQKTADWLIWSDPTLRGRTAFDVRFELLSAETLRRIQRLYLAAGEGWKGEARGYRLLVLDKRDDPLSTRAFRAEPGRQVLYDDGAMLVILRSTGSAT